MLEEKLRDIKFKKYEDFHFTQANHNYLFTYTNYLSSKETENGNCKFFDWVITSSFYSALHYIRCIISIDKDFNFYNVRFENKTFDEAVKDRKINDKNYPNDAAISKHDILKEIVRETYPTVSKHYNRLFDKSMTSRYNQYKHCAVEECEKVLELLDEIRDWFAQKTTTTLHSYEKVLM